MSFRPAPKPTRLERARRPMRTWRRPKDDQVTPELVGALLGRQDGLCIAAIIEPAARGDCAGRLTVEHTREHAAMGAPRAPSTERWTVLACEWHHIRSGWITAHKPEIRSWLADRSAEEGLEDDAG